ncbi:MAG: aquaporin [Gemmatimonadetes bacterium]|nr:aquaporin [Gemmatimonadota bacterium]
MKPRAILSELLGTFALTLAVVISLNNPGFSVSTPVLAALTLGLFVYLIGPISGCHINPAITIGVFAIGRISAQESAAYIVAQFAGAGLAMAIGGVFFPIGAELEVSRTAMTGFAELFGTALLAIAVASVVVKRVPGNLSGIVIGLGLLVGIAFAAHASNGVLNPAVALGIGSFSHPYVWGPVGGALVGALVSNYLLDPELA